MQFSPHAKPAILLFVSSFFGALSLPAIIPGIEREPAGLFNESREELSVLKADPTQSMKQALSAFIAREWRIPIDQSKALVRKAFTASQDHELDPLLVLAVMAQESSFRNFGNAHAWLREPGAVVNPLAAHGPMQVAGRWHPEKMPRDADGNIRQTTLEENVSIGARILREYLELDRGDLRAALQRYNGNRADQAARYAHAVLTHLQSMEAALNSAMDVALSDVDAQGN